MTTATRAPMPTLLSKVAFVVLALGPLLSGSALRAAARPNVLVFFTDDQRRSTIHALGNHVIQTPNLDRLVEQGATFTRAYMMGGMIGATCVPSRAMLHTGRHLFHLHNSGHGIQPDTPTLAETFRAAGYHTFFTGKRHAMDRQTLRRGFESGGVVMGFAGYFTDKRRMPIHDWDPEAKYNRDDGYVLTGPDRRRLTIGEMRRRKLKPSDIEPGPFSTELYVEPAIEFIRDYKDDRPFFMYVSLSAPHDPHQAPERFHKLYDPATIPLPPNFLPEHPFDNGEMDVRDEKLAPRPRDPQVIRQRTADYYACVSFIDDLFGRLVRALKDTGRLQNTILVFMGDSGLAVGQHGLLGKQNLYDDAGIGVPFIMAGPGVPQNLRTDSLVCSFDLYPTLCELAGIPIPPTVDGRSLTHLFRRPDEPHRPFVYAAYRDVQRAVVGPRFKLIEYVPQTRQQKDGSSLAVGTRATQLFDLANDPWETRNLADDPAHADQLRRLRRQLLRLREQYGDGTDASQADYPEMHDSYTRFWKNYR